MPKPRKILLLATAIFFAAGAANAADRAEAAASKPEVAGQVSPDLQKLIEQFKSRRDSMLADRQLLLDQLKNATVEERKQILDKMQTQQKQLVEAQRALGKQIRDEMRRLRESTPGSRR
jgi:hypothetical protein